MKIVALMFALSFLLSGCTLMLGAAVGGAVGYYAGKEGYKIKVEKEKE